MSAILNIGSRAALAAFPSSYPAAIIINRNPIISARLCVICSGERGSPCSPRTDGDPKTLLHLAQQQNPAIGRQQATIEFGTTALPETGDRPETAA